MVAARTPGPPGHVGKTAVPAVGPALPAVSAADRGEATVRAGAVAAVVGTGPAPVYAATSVPVVATVPAAVHVTTSVPAAGTVPAAVHVTTNVPAAGTVPAATRVVAIARVVASAQLRQTGPAAETTHAGREVAIPTGLVVAPGTVGGPVGRRILAVGPAEFAPMAPPAAMLVRAAGALAQLTTSGVRCHGESLAHRRRTVRSIR